ncbi:PD-(D/E)XK nuclease family protein [Mesoplasma photuris]|uniref:PD-(D/E)XK nuclease family protein n=1 Tax=Mesoplasma photuris TaxID=217731 RepID=UPI0004E0D742|nr:PD-(D/E)XK nuclease family protein [Mesoplasma photuris]
MKIKEYYINPTIILNEETHEYLNTVTNSIIDLKSVTNLVQNIYPFDASNIPPAALEFGIEKGICVHNRLSDYIINNNIGYCDHSANGYPIRTHSSEFNWIKRHLDKIDTLEVYSEVSLSNGKYNGTFDLLYKDLDDKWHLVDFKTTSRLNEDKECLQLKFYEQLLQDNFEDIQKIDYFEIYNSKNEIHYKFKESRLNSSEILKEEILTKYL